MWKVTFALSDPFTPIGIKTIVNDEYANLEVLDIVAHNLKVICNPLDCNRVAIPGCDNLHHSSEREHSSRKARQAIMWPMKVHNVYIISCSL